MSDKTPQKQSDSDVMTKEKSYKDFLYWYVMPKQERRSNNLPVTIKEYSDKTGVSQKDIASYTNRPYFNEDVAEKALKWGKSKTREILHWAFNVVRKEKKLDDMEQFVRLLEKLEEKQAVSGGSISANNVNFLNVNEEQYRQIIDRESRTIEGSSQEQTS